jgi:hypothetical protein
MPEKIRRLLAWRKDFRAIGRNAQVPLHERAYKLLLQEGERQAEAAQAVALTATAIAK